MKLKYIMLSFILSLMSCDSYQDIHKEYIEGGEIVYLQKVDSIASYSGNNRIQFKLWYTNGTRLSKTIIYYNNFKDSMLVNLVDKLNPGIDSLVVDINPLPEGNYNFDIINYNNYNQKSLTVSYFASIYGEAYQTLLKNRVLRSYELFDTGFRVHWHPQSDGYTKLELEYTSSTGVKTVTIKDTTSAIINEIPIDNIFRYRTFYKPEPSSIDDFPCEWSNRYELVEPN